MQLLSANPDKIRIVIPASCYCNYVYTETQPPFYPFFYWLLRLTALVYNCVINFYADNYATFHGFLKLAVFRR